jgi:hypothetical protein
VVSSATAPIGPGQAVDCQRGRHRGVQRLGAPPHRQPGEIVAGLTDQSPHAFPFTADHEAEPLLAGRGLELGRSGNVQTHQTETRSAGGLHRTHQVGDTADGQMHRRSRRRPQDGRIQHCRTSLGQHHTQRPGRLGSADDGPEIVRIRDLIEEHQQALASRQQRLQLGVMIGDFGRNPLGTDTADLVTLGAPYAGQSQAGLAGARRQGLDPVTGPVLHEDSMGRRPLTIQCRLDGIWTTYHQVDGAVGAGVSVTTCVRSAVAAVPACHLVQGRFAARQGLSTLRGSMGKILHRYFLTEIATAFLGGVAIFTFIVFIERIIELVDLVFARGVPGHLVMGLFAYILPSFLEFTVPMALLLGIVVAFSRLASDGELLALRAAGINIFQMLGPVLVFAAITAVVTLALTVHVRPWGNRNVRETLFEIAKTKATAALRPRFFNTDFEDLVIYVDDISPDSGALEGVMLSDERDSSRRTTVFAERGRIVGNEDAQTVYLHLLDGTSISFQATRTAGTG